MSAHRFNVGDVVTSIYVPGASVRVESVNLVNRNYVVTVLSCPHAPKQVGKTETYNWGDLEYSATLTPRGDTPPPPPKLTCSCAGYTLLHEGCKCGAVSKRRWGLGA